MQLYKLFTIYKDQIADLLTKTRGLDEAGAAALRSNLDTWFTGIPTNAGAYMFRDVVTALRANGDATTAKEIGKLAEIDAGAAAGKAVSNA